MLHNSKYLLKWSKGPKGFLDTFVWHPLTLTTIVSIVCIHCYSSVFCILGAKQKPHSELEIKNRTLSLTMNYL